jgi:hypothetical protein
MIFGKAFAAVLTAAGLLVQDAIGMFGFPSSVVVVVVVAPVGSSAHSELQHTP